MGCSLTRNNLRLLCLNLFLISFPVNKVENGWCFHIAWACLMELWDSLAVGFGGILLVLESIEWVGGTFSMHHNSYEKLAWNILGIRTCSTGILQFPTLWLASAVQQQVAVNLRLSGGGTSHHGKVQYGKSLKSTFLLTADLLWNIAPISHA